LEKKKVFFNSQKEFIEKLHAQYQDIPDPIIEGRLFTDTAPLEYHTGILGKVKDVHAINRNADIILLFNLGAFLD